MIRILVCGGRDYKGRDLIESELTAQWRRFAKHEGMMVVTGYDPWDGRYQGADQIAYEWARRIGVPVATFPAPWHRLGKAAGPARNLRMFDDMQPDIVMAFPGGRGTANMVKIAKSAERETLEY